MTWRELLKAWGCGMVGALWIHVADVATTTPTAHYLLGTVGGCTVGIALGTLICGLRPIPKSVSPSLQGRAGFEDAEVARAEKPRPSSLEHECPVCGVTWPCHTGGVCGTRYITCLPCDLRPP